MTSKAPGQQTVKVQPFAGSPDDLAELAEMAMAEGYRFVVRLVDELTSGANRFDREGETLIIASEPTGRLVGVAGRNIDPYAGDPAIGRVRRFYVDPGMRRQGTGRLLLDQIVAGAAGHFEALRVRTANPGAAAFYEVCGFIAGPGPHRGPATHRLELGR